MTQPDAADAIMEIMQNYVDKERKEIWELVTKQNKEWCKNAKRFIQIYIDREAKSPQDSLNQVYAKGPFAGGSVGSVVSHAIELLKEENPSLWSKIQIHFPFGHRHYCLYGTDDCKMIPCNCGLHKALAELKENADG